MVNTKIKLRVKLAKKKKKIPMSMGKNLSLPPLPWESFSLESLWVHVKFFPCLCKPNIGILVNMGKLIKFSMKLVQPNTPLVLKISGQYTCHLIYTPDDNI